MLMSKIENNCGCEKKHDDKDSCKKEIQFHELIFATLYKYSNI